MSYFAIRIEFADRLAEPSEPGLPFPRAFQTHGRESPPCHPLTDKRSNENFPVILVLFLNAHF